MVAHPRAKIRLLVIVSRFVSAVRVPAWVLIPLWVSVELVKALLVRDRPVAHWAHVGGFAFGLVVAFAMHRLGWVYEDKEDLV